MKALAALALAVGITLAPVHSAEAAQPPAKCRVLSSSTVTETRDVSGAVTGVSYVNGHPLYTYGHSIQHRTVTTTTQRCRGKVTTTTTASPWGY